MAALWVGQLSTWTRAGYTGWITAHRTPARIVFSAERLGLHEDREPDGSFPFLHRQARFIFGILVHEVMHDHVAVSARATHHHGTEFSAACQKAGTVLGIDARDLWPQASRFWPQAHDRGFFNGYVPPPALMKRRVPRMSLAAIAPLPPFQPCSRRQAVALAPSLAATALSLLETQ